MDTGISSRVEALRILFRWMRTGDFPDRMLGRIDPELRGFVMELVYATVRWVRALEEVLSPRLRQRPSDDAEAALLLGAVQLLKLTQIPGYAAVHATVEALKLFGGRRAPVGLVNAVLRDMERNRERDLARLSGCPLAIRTSHPDDLVERWTSCWGEPRTEAICDWNNRPADVMVLTLPQGPDAATLLQRFRDAGLTAEPHATCPEAIVLGHGIRVEQIPGFSEGEFSIQDPSTLAAVRLMDLQPDVRVLDACASPGGKAARIARLLNGRGKLLAADRHADRIPALRDTLARLARHPQLDILQLDATTVTPDQTGGLFDRILLDAPCSNTGVLRRRPDARWRATPERTRQLVELQARMLENTASLLAPGGRLVYSTCSIDEAENLQQIERFLRNHPEWTLADSSSSMPPEMDGTFAAALLRP